MREKLKAFNISTKTFNALAKWIIFQMLYFDSQTKYSLYFSHFLSSVTFIENGNGIHTVYKWSYYSKIYMIISI